MITINLTEEQHTTLLELINRGFAYMDEHSNYRDWQKMEKVYEIIKKHEN